MAYNPYEAVKNIFNLKGQWDEADKAGEKEKANKIANQAQQYYDMLRSSGYGGVADELASKNYQQSQFVHDYYGKLGATEFRPYMYSLGKEQGLSTTDVDKLINWDETTGEISFGGKKLGQPSSVVDGSSYFTDTSVLDNAFKNYVDRSSLTRPSQTVVDQERERNIREQRDELAFLQGVNPFETDVGKSILSRYDYQAMRGRDNEAASGAAANAGNIDSYAAANAQRRQAYLTSLGEQSAMAAHQQRVDNVYRTLAMLSGEVDKVFEQDQAAQRNKITNELAVAETFGTATGNQFTNPYIGKDMDFKAAYDAAKASGANSTILNQLAEARFIKQVNMNDFSAGFIPFEPTSRETANMLLTNKQIDSAERIAGGQLKGDLDKIAATTEGQKEIIKTQAEYGVGEEKKSALTPTQAYAAYKDGVRTPEVVQIVKEHYGEEAADVDDGLSNEDRVKRLIHTIPPDGSSGLYFPLQELQRNRHEFEQATSKEFIDDLIVEEGVKIMKAEGGKEGKWELGEVLKQQGFSDYKALEKKYKK